MMINRLNQWIFVLIIVMFNKFNLIFALNEEEDVIEKGNALGQNITKILNAFFSSGYDKRVRPNYGGPPVEVGISVYFTSISSVSEVKMDFTSDFYFRQEWKDPRLSFDPLPGISNLYVGAEVAKKIWVPDTFFANEKQAYFHVATTPNRFLRIAFSGLIYQSIRLTVTASCPMSLQYFPMDRQACSIEIESYGYSMRDIKYVWSKGNKSVDVQGDVTLPQFKIMGHEQESAIAALTTGNYSRLICKIKFSRSLGFYLIQIYIPASLIVVISWVSFWLHRNATPARVSLGVTTVLTMTTLMSSTNAQLPKISYIKSIDVFLGTCFVMVFASLLEYATVGYLGKRIAMRKSRIEQLTKLADEHRKKCAAAAAAADAAVAEQSAAQVPPQLICATTGLPLDPALQLPCGIKNPVHHQGNRCIGGPPPKMVYGGCPQKMNSGILEAKQSGKIMNEASSMTLGGGGPGNQPPPTPVPFGPKDPNRMLGVSPSDIDKYSRVVFPVCFICFNLMYWIIYMHISASSSPN
uniref:Gamma-aminobutyric acid receptor subunit beta n=1 Tax=Tetranychus cinnabarinus TaxID=93129 RepID=A0A0U2XI79_TETCI|nr:GABA gated chloride channel RDL2 [Tetranychus cinnabarinus]